MSIFEDPDNAELDIIEQEEEIEIPDIDLDLEPGEEPMIDEDETE